MRILFGIVAIIIQYLLLNVSAEHPKYLGNYAAIDKYIRSGVAKIQSIIIKAEININKTINKIGTDVDQLVRIAAANDYSTQQYQDEVHDLIRTAFQSVDDIQENAVLDVNKLIGTTEENFVDSTEGPKYQAFTKTATVKINNLVREAEEKVWKIADKAKKVLWIDFSIAEGKLSSVYSRYLLDGDQYRAFGRTDDIMSETMRAINEELQAANHKSNDVVEKYIAAEFQRYLEWVKETEALKDSA